MNKSFTRLFIKFFTPYLIIILLMGTMSLGVYSVAIGKMEKNALSIQQSYVEQSKSVLDRRFKEAIDASMQLKQIGMVNAFKSKTREELDKEYYSAVVLLNQISNMVFVNEIIEEYYLFYKNSGIIASAANINYYNEYSNDIFGVYDRDKAEYWDSLFTEYHRSTVQPTELFRVYKRDIVGVPVITTLGHNYGDPEAVILMILDSNKLKESMMGYQRDFGGNFFIVDENNQVLLSLNNQIGVNEESLYDYEMISNDFIEFKSESEVIDYVYCMIIPKEVVFAEISAMRKTAIIFMGLVLFFGFIASFISARYNTKPVHQMANNNEVLSERVKNQLPYIRMNFLERWLKGNYSNIEEIKVITKYLKANYIGDFYCVVVIDYDQQIDIMSDFDECNMNELEMKRLVVKDILTKDLLRLEYVHDLDHDKLAVIFIADGIDRDAFEMTINQQIRACNDVLNDESIDGVRYGVGQVYEDMAEVATSLNNAMDALATITGSDREIVWFAELGDNKASYYYPAEVENRLFNCTRAGDIEQVELILRDIFKRNILEKTLPPHMLNIFIYEIWGTLAKVQERTLGEDNEVSDMITKAFEAINEKSDLEKIQFCKKTFIQVCETIHLDGSDRREQALRKITRYVDESYKDPDFCLPMVAEKFDLSYAYLSQVFKEFNNESFINYLQKLRMQEAERLLLETDMPVKLVVSACGYNSSNTFGKAFKRIHGVSASVFREKRKSS